jgi:predicted nucleic acid-binding protein
VIVLDTNVISEMMRASPGPEVAAWFALAAPSALFTTALTQAEVLYGIALVSPGRRRDDLAAAADAMFTQDMAGRVLAFDADAARHFAEIAANRRQAGRPISQIDAQIAAIARSRGASLATRNVDDFTDCGVVLINPWTAK